MPVCLRLFLSRPDVLLARKSRVLSGWFVHRKDFFMADELIDTVLAGLSATRRKVIDAHDVPDSAGLYALHGSNVTWNLLGLGAAPDARPLYVGKAERFQHLELAVWPKPMGSVDLAAIEAQVILRWSPPLNIHGNAGSSWIRKIRAARQRMALDSAELGQSRRDDAT